MQIYEAKKERMNNFPLRRMPNRTYLEAQARIFKALGHPSRLLMAEALTRGPFAWPSSSISWGRICPQFPGISQY